MLRYESLRFLRRLQAFEKYEPTATHGDRDGQRFFINQPYHYDLAREKRIPC
jgi:hypothetical protein